MPERMDYLPMPEGTNPIDWLVPNSPQHAAILQYVKDRINLSERKMSAFYPRWRNNELMLQAYISLKDFDRMLEGMRNDRTGPDMDQGPVAINVPFAWSTVNTIVTYLLHMFAGRSPIFTVGSYRAEQVNRAKNMEMYLQYNADVVKFVRALYFFLMDGETYGLAIMRTMWKQETKSRIIQVPPHPDLVAVGQAQGLTPQPTSQRQEYVSFEGNSCVNVDPYMFFPDPRVPMHEVNEKGEWVSWRSFMGRNSLLKEQAAGRLKWVDKVDDTRAVDNEADGDSLRGVRALGLSSPGRDGAGENSRIAPNLQVDQGTFEIIPKDLGLGDSEVPEKWLITILNKRQIVQAIPVDMPTGKHPVVVCEPNSVGYSFGNLGTVDMLGPMQQLMSWFMNSHIYNVRAALNNMFVVDPTKVEMTDFKNPKPGKLIRLKNTAFGLNDPKMAVQQLQVSDVTRSHLQDFQMFGRMASDLTGASDNARGLQDAGGRKTATEIRTVADAGASRLASKGKVYSAMALTDLSETWAINAQSNLTQDFETAILGSMQPGESIRITPESIQGDFTFPVNDGTLPVDKLAMLEVWKEIFLGISQDPELRSSYDLLDMFDWIAQLGGAQNIKSFRINQVAQTTQMGALGGQGPLAAQGIPMQQVLAAMQSQASAGPRGLTPGV